MAFFSSQKAHKIKHSHSTDRVKLHTTTSISSSEASIPPIRTRSSSRPATIYDPQIHVQGPDPIPPTPKLNGTTFTRRQSLRRIPVPSLSIEDLNVLPRGRPRTSPTIPSSRSTSVSRKSSIVDIGGVFNATASKTKSDQLRLSANTRTPTPPYSLESTNEGSQNPVGAARDVKKTSSSIFGLSILVSSPKQVTTPTPSPRSTSQKPQRAVLRRKSSAKPPPNPLPSVHNLPHLKAQPDSGLSSVTVTPQRPVSPTRQSPPHLVSNSLSLDAAHGVRRSISDERRPRSSPVNVPPSVSPRRLTPAGAVAAAYKEQEKRKDLKDFVHASHRNAHDENGGVYYTVFGTSGKVVAVGAPADESWANHDLTNYSSNKPKSVSRKPSLGPLGRLSRKSSTKVKKIGSVCGITSESESGHERITRDEEAGRLSLQGRRSLSLPNKHRAKKPLGISTDNPGVALISDSPQSASTYSKSAGWSLDDPPSAGGKIWKLMKRISTGGLREKYNVQEAAPPVPALPEGLLPTPPPKPPKPKTRSAPQSPEDSKRPISHYIRGRSSFGDAPFSSRRRDTQGVSSMASSHRPPTLSSGKNPSHRRRSTNTRSSSPVSSDKASSKYWQKSRSSSVSTFEEMPPLPERVVTSGPILSPLELSKLEREQAMVDLSSPPSTVDSHSPAASPPNYGNTLIVIRKPSLRGVHVRPNAEDSETDGMSTSDFVALPSPPRHHYRSNPHVVYHQSDDNGPTVGSVSTSPTIPMFSTQDVVNQFQPVKGSSGVMSRSLNSLSTSQSTAMSSNEFGVQPPPRPQRSDKRKTLIANQQVTTRASQDRGRDGYHSRGTLLPKERMLTVSQEYVDDDGDGRSCGTFGSSQSKGMVEFVQISQDSSSSREDLKPSSSSIHSRSTLKFREMGEGEGSRNRGAWTEEEKAERWEDLLEKSDRAGGTIHIGNANTKLLSDSLRFSDYSTLTTSAL